MIIKIMMIIVTIFIINLDIMLMKIISNGQWKETLPIDPCRSRPLRLRSLGKSPAVQVSPHLFFVVFEGPHGNC